MAPAPIKVYPTKPSALVISRFKKDRPALTIDGAMWPLDSFTHCRLNDGSITKDPAKGLKAEAPAAAAEAAPSDHVAAEASPSEHAAA